MDCLPLQYEALIPIIEARKSIIGTEPLRIECIRGILAIHDKILNILILIDADGDMGLCNQKGCAELPEDFIERYQRLLISKSA